MAASRLLLASALLATASTGLDWWQTTVFYQIYPRSFQDSDGDGVGDLRGIISRLQHLKDAGVAATWLSPIFKSPMADFGYDIADFCSIDPLFGTMDDFEALKARAQELGIKLILDFVPNHSSTEGEWFKKSVKREDPYTDFFVWEDGKPNAENCSKRDPPNNWVSFFRGPAWEWSEERGQYYLHQFAVAQPDLNYRNPALVEEMKNVLRFWLDKGVDGFRVDAVPCLFEDKQLPDEPLSGDPAAEPGDGSYLLHIYTQNQPETFDMLQQWRQVLDGYAAKDNHTRVMMAEAHAAPDVTMQYYGTQERPAAHFPFNFQLITRLSNEFTAEDVRQAVLDWETKKPDWAWSNWVIGNHDNHRPASRFGSKRADGFNLLVQLLPGSAVTYNGDEIAMEDTFITWEQSRDPFAINAGPERYRLFTRDPERTPFQWDDSLNAGFSASPNGTWLPVNPNYRELNLAAQRRQSNRSRSHFSVFQRLVAARQLPAARAGALDIQALPGNVLAFSRHLTGERTLAAAVNLDAEPQTADLRSLAGVPVDGPLSVLAASGEAALAEGDIVQPGSVTLRPCDAVLLLQEPAL